MCSKCSRKLQGMSQLICQTLSNLFPGCYWLLKCWSFQSVHHLQHFRTALETLFLLVLLIAVAPKQRTALPNYSCTLFHYHSNLKKKSNLAVCINTTKKKGCANCTNTARDFQKFPFFFQLTSYLYDVLSSKDNQPVFWCWNEFPCCFIYVFMYVNFKRNFDGTPRNKRAYTVSDETALYTRYKIL